MRLNRFYTERQNLRINSSVKLPDSDIDHIRKVLRLQSGDKVIIFNGVEEYLAELKLVTREFVTAKLVELLKTEKNSTKETQVTIFQGLLRAGKFDLIIEKLTEIGIDNIIPVECEFSQTKKENAAAKVSRWSKVALAAAKQSERISLPLVLDPIDFKDILKVKNDFDKVLMFTLPRNNIKESLDAIELSKDVIGTAKNVAVLIGPEGGFSPTEHKIATENGFTLVKSSDSVLRSETAAIVFSAIVKFLLK